MGVAEQQGIPSATVNPSAGRRSALIDSLRGLAALAVVFYHFLAYFPLMKVPTSALTDIACSLAQYGHFGVQVFFVISGFVIAMTAERILFVPATASRFTVRRLVRLVPPYWAMLMIVLTYHLSATLVAGSTSNSITTGQFAAHTVYLQDWLGYRSLDPVYWTLCLEVQFYLAFAILAMVAARRGWNRSATLLIAATAVGSALTQKGDWAVGAFVPYWYQFAAGVLAFRATRSTMELRLAALIALALAGREVWQQSGDDGIAAVAVSLLAVATRAGWQAECLDRLGFPALGRVSYSLYLCHAFVAAIVFYRLKPFVGPGEAGIWLRITVMSVVTAGVTIVLYQLVELRAVGWSKRVRISQRQSTNPVS